MRGGVATWVLLGVLGTAVVGAGAVVAIRSGEALPGTTVAGVDVGGLGRADVRAAVEAPVRERTSGPLEVTDGETTVALDRGELTEDVDVVATVDAAMTAGRTGYPLARFLGPLLPVGDRRVEIEVDVDDEALAERVEQLATELDAEATPGGFEIEGTTVTPVAPETGLVLDTDDAQGRIRTALVEARRGPVDLPVEEVVPATTQADVDRVVEQARRALAAGYRLEGEGASLEVSPAEVAPHLRARLIGEDDLQLRVDLPGLNELVAGLAAGIEQPARSARFTVAGGPPRVTEQGNLTWEPRPAQVDVVPSATGRDVQVDAATARLAEIVLAGERTGPLPIETTRPRFSTEDAQAAGVRSLIGTFTTSYTAGQPRARNIARIAEIVNGTYVAPGETFSLNGTAGRRTTARGFVADGAIIGGQLEDVVGGGVSQFATTIFNAAFFAGVPIPEHRPHSFYISRYPAGRESTVNFGSIDVKFRNDTGNGIHVHATTTASSVTVGLYGDNGGRRVSAVHGPRQPRDGGGFRIEVTRTVVGGDGRGGTRVFTTTYNPPPD